MNLWTLYILSINRNLSNLLPKGNNMPSTHFSLHQFVWIFTTLKMEIQTHNSNNRHVRQSVSQCALRSKITSSHTNYVNVSKHSSEFSVCVFIKNTVLNWRFFMISIFQCQVEVGIYIFGGAVWLSGSGLCACDQKGEWQETKKLWNINGLL